MALWIRILLAARHWFLIRRYAVDQLSPGTATTLSLYPRARESQLLSPHAPNTEALRAREPAPARREATTVRTLHTTTGRGDATSCASPEAQC